MNDMNLFQQFIAYFQENGGYVFAQFVRHFLIYLWRFIRCNRWYSTRNLDF